MASDLTPELIEVGRRLTGAAGLPVEWLPADAERPPFDTGEFDVVRSSIGVMFAPNHAAAAAELTRVCRPGGTIALANWTPDGNIGRFFALLGRYAPPADGPAPTAWGDPAYLATLFGSTVAELSAEPRRVRLPFTGSPAELRDYYRAWFGPIIATYASLGDDGRRRAALDQDLLDFFGEENTGPVGGPGRYECDYLRVIARTASPDG